MTNGAQKLLPLDHPQAPKFWRNEQSGVLAPAIQKYLDHQEMTVRDVAIMRAYLRQWIMSPVWDENPHGGFVELNGLRQIVGRIASVADLDAWIAAACDFGMDPL